MKPSRQDFQNWLFRVRTRWGQRNIGSIISNNCWGGFIYQRLGLPYRSPFVGLFLMPDCYLTLLENLQEVVWSPLSFKHCSKYQFCEEFRRTTPWPIGVLAGSIELHFMHSASQDDAKADWCRRLERFDRDRIYVKLCDRDGCTRQHMQRFDALPFERKVCFVSQPDIRLESVVYIPGYESNGELPTFLADVADATFDTAHWLRTGIRRQAPEYVRWCTLLLEQRADR